ncbi:MAG: sortase-like acyltransferase [Herbinix sp.]|jgi:phosphinothricin acetyltransferase|nr:sortase-like acyltransferase [Herbinix sp.]
MNEKIRLATGEDAAAILSIYEPYILNSAITFETETISIEDFKRRMAKVQGQFPWLVYEEEGRVVGYAYASSYRERAAFAWDCECSVYIAKEAHRKGIATKLYLELLDRLKAQGYYNVYAFITYPHDSSVELHKKFGFREVGIFYKTGYKQGKWWDLIVMEKALRDFDQEPVNPLLPKADER